MGTPVHHKAARIGVQPPRAVPHKLRVQLQLWKVDLAVEVEVRSARSVGSLHLRQRSELLLFGVRAPTGPLLVIDDHDGQRAEVARLLRS